MPDEVTRQELNASIQTLTKAVNRLERSLDEERVERVDQAAWFKRWCAIGTVLILLALGVGLQGWQAQADAEDRNERNRIATCRQQAEDRLDVIAEVKSSKRLLIEALTADAVKTPDLEHRILTYYRISDYNTDVKLKVRDCTPEGIDDYLKNTGGYIAIPTTIPDPRVP